MSDFTTYETDKEQSKAKKLKSKQNLMTKNSWMVLQKHPLMVSQNHKINIEGVEMHAPYLFLLLSWVFPACLPHFNLNTQHNTTQQSRASKSKLSLLLLLYGK